MHCHLLVLGCYTAKKTIEKASQSRRSGLIIEVNDIYLVVTPTKTFKKGLSIKEQRPNTNRGPMHNL